MRSDLWPAGVLLIVSGSRGIGDALALVVPSIPISTCRDVDLADVFRDRWVVQALAADSHKISALYFGSFPGDSPSPFAELISAYVVHGRPPFQ